VEQSRLFGVVIITVGIVAALIGVAILTGGLTWFGRLPGDIKIDGGRTRVFIPLTSMLIVSLVLILIGNLVCKLLR